MQRRAGENVPDRRKGSAETNQRSGDTYTICATPGVAGSRREAKNPPEAHRIIIRDWGVLNADQPLGQTRCSKVLVRHGADGWVGAGGRAGGATDDISLGDSPE
jgi:hypothetical protein